MRGWMTGLVIGVVVGTDGFWPAAFRPRASGVI